MSLTEAQGRGVAGWAFPPQDSDEAVPFDGGPFSLSFSTLPSGLCLTEFGDREGDIRE